MILQRVLIHVQNGMFQDRILYLFGVSNSLALLIPTFRVMCLPSFGSYCAIITDIA